MVAADRQRERHSGNDRKHAIVRRWVAPRSGTIAMKSTLQHQVDAGDGIREFVISSRHGILKAANRTIKTLNLIWNRLTSKQATPWILWLIFATFLIAISSLWSPVLTMPSKDSDALRTWDAEHDFQASAEKQVILSPWQQYVQMLLSANEFVFVD